MNCYPVIYTRTFQCDYFSNFHVIPDFVDASWLMPYIRSATTDMNPTNSHTKKIIVTDTEICVFGIIGYAKDIIDIELSDCTRDNKGRAVYGFYGFAVQVDENLHTVPDFSKKIISELYKKYICPVWNDTVQNTQISDAVNLNEKTACNGELHEDFFWNEYLNVFSAESDLYDVLLHKALTGDFVSYCSHITDYKTLKKTPFNFIVTTPNNLNRLKNEPVIKAEPPTEEISALVEETDFNSYVENPYISDSPSEISEDSEGSKKNRLMEENNPFSEESVPKEEIKSEIEQILRKYIPYAMASFIASLVVTAIAEYVCSKKKAGEEKEGKKDAE